jgi:hypothetical protein
MSVVLSATVSLSACGGNVGPTGSPATEDQRTTSSRDSEPGAGTRSSKRSTVDKACPLPPFRPKYLPWEGRQQSTIRPTGRGHDTNAGFSYFHWEAEDPSFPHASALLIRLRSQDHRNVTRDSRLRINGTKTVIYSGPGKTGYANAYFAEGPPLCRSYNFEIELRRAGYSANEAERELRKVLKSLER